jgi:predicted transposase YbfD/YdcC
MDNKPVSIFQCFGRLRDPRRSKRQKKHLLLDIVAIALCAVIAGAEDWPEVVTFAQQRQQWLATFLTLANGIPSQSTFERVFSALSPTGLQGCLLQWLRGCSELLDVGHIAIDGKTLRGSSNPSQALGPLHLVSAWACHAQLSLGQVAVDQKSNEITAIPYLLFMLNLKGVFVSIDAMGCQKEIARQIVDAGGDYVLTVKENQGGLHSDILDVFEQAHERDFQGYEHDQYQVEEQGHGRKEKRSYTVLYNLDGITDREKWKGLAVIGMCYTERTKGDRESSELRLFIGSRRASAQVYGQVLRGHWGIENNLHWQLDVTFREDANQVADRNKAQNLALLRKWALGLLKRYPGKESIKVKRYKAALNTDVLEAILDAQ